MSQFHVDVGLTNYWALCVVVEELSCCKDVISTLFDISEEIDLLLSIQYKRL